MKVKCDHRSEFSNLSNWKEEAWKKNIRASTGFEPVTSAIPVRCSTNWAMQLHIRSEVNLLRSPLPVHSSVGRALHRYWGGHGFESRWSPDFLHGSSFQLHKLEKFTAMITLHFHLEPQYKYELFHTNFTVMSVSLVNILHSSTPILTPSTNTSNL